MVRLEKRQRMAVGTMGTRPGRPSPRNRTFRCERRPEAASARRPVLYGLSRWTPGALFMGSTVGISSHLGSWDLGARNRGRVLDLPLHDGSVGQRKRDLSINPYPDRP